MSNVVPRQHESAFGALRKFVRKGTSVERCELCSREIAEEHEHLVELAKRKLLCACTQCAILFGGQSGAKYKRVPRRVVYLQDFRMSDAQWEGLMVPIEMAFFFKSTPHGRVIALYPSPAGPTESLLPLDTWADIVQMNPLLNEMEADVVALLVNRVAHDRSNFPPDYFLVPIDECYKLVGLIRSNWRGFSGGPEVWREITAFFAALRNKAGCGRGGALA